MTVGSATLPVTQTEVKMKKLLILTLALLMNGLLFAEEPAQPPSWIKKATAEPGKHYEWGTGVSKQMAVANNLARMDAMAKMSQWVSSRVEVHSTAIRLEFKGAGLDESVTLLEQVVKSSSETVLNGLVTENTDVQMDMRNFRVYVLLSLPVESVAAELKRQLQEKTNFYDLYGGTVALKALDTEAKGGAKVAPSSNSGQ